MAVKFTKPEINVREKLAELDKPSGIAGEAMLRAETPQEQQALIGVGRRNLIINGDFDVWQRGTSFSANAYTADRWISSVGTITKDGAALKHVSTNTDPYLLYKVEDVGNKLAGYKAVFSFYLKTSGSDNKLQYLTFCGTNYYHSQMHQLPSELEGYTRWACPVEITNANTDFIRIVIELHNVSGHTSWLRKVQLETGKVATPFEHRSYGEELALCQRYYQRIDGTHITGNATNDRGIYHGHLWQINNVYWVHHFVTPMRTGPSFVLSTSAGSIGTWYSSGSTATPTTFLLQSSNTNRAEHSGSISSNLTAGNSAWFRVAANQWVAYNAEL